MTTYPVCAGCDCVDGCSKVKDKACMTTNNTTMGSTRVFSNLENQCHGYTAPQPVIAPSQPERQMFGGCPSCGKSSCIARNCTQPVIAPAWVMLTDAELRDIWGTSLSINLYAEAIQAAFIAKQGDNK
jgi:hypothetical protein